MFLEGGRARTPRPRSEEQELRRLQAQIGDMTMRLSWRHLLEGVAEDVRKVAEVSRRRRSIVGRRYPLRTVSTLTGARSSVYALTAAPATALTKRGEQAQSDLEVVERILRDSRDDPFHGEGHREVRVRLRQRGSTSARRVCCG